MALRHLAIDAAVLDQRGQTRLELVVLAPLSWQTDLEKTIKAVNWRPGPHWNGIAMIGDRINNTGPGINATAGYILECGGFKKGQGVEIDKLLDLLAKSRGGEPTAVGVAA